MCPQIAFIWPLFSKSPLLAVRYLRSTHAMTTNLWNLFLINHKEMKNQHCVLSQLMFWFWTTMVCFMRAAISIERCGRILGGTVRYLGIYFNTNFFILWLHFQLAPWCSCRTEGGEIFTNHKKTLPWIYGSWQMLMTLEIDGNSCQCVWLYNNAKTSDVK